MNERSTRNEELLDVVDELDQVIGTRTRGEIHRLGLIHRAVHMLIFNDQGQLFLQKRSMNKDENPGLWDSSAAGHVDSGETYDDCARREVMEELGVQAECRRLFKLSPTTATGMEHCWVYRVEHNGPFTLQEEEVDEGQWLSPVEMDQQLAVPDHQITDVLGLIWHRYRALAGQ